MQTALLRGVVAAAALLCVSVEQGMTQELRPRAREAGVVVGVFGTGAHNAITDVAGVRVGHATVRGETGNTGVTAILPPATTGSATACPPPSSWATASASWWASRRCGSSASSRRRSCSPARSASGAPPTPWWSGCWRRPGMQDVRSINPVVGETNDGSPQRHPRPPRHARAARGAGAGGRRGRRGGGRRRRRRRRHRRVRLEGRHRHELARAAGAYGGYTVGVLVQSNYGGILTINGAPVGRELGRYSFMREVEAQRGTIDGAPPSADPTPDGSIMIVVATDAPLDPRNLERLARRALFGLARTGSTMSNGSGDYVIAFSTAESVRRRPGDRTTSSDELLPNDAMTSALPGRGRGHGGGHLQLAVARRDHVVPGTRWRRCRWTARWTCCAATARSARGAAGAWRSGAPSASRRSCAMPSGAVLEERLELRRHPLGVLLAEVDEPPR
jgi:D-aminopeptidase